MTKTVVIDESRCNGCGLCVNACHEGALGLVDGKAKLINGLLCDGIGDCLPACPQDAISFADSAEHNLGPMVTMDCQWPIKLELVAERNPLLDGKHLLIAADCSAFARASIMNEFGRDGVKIIGCPKLGEGRSGETEGHHCEQRHKVRRCRQDGGAMLRTARAESRGSGEIQREGSAGQRDNPDPRRKYPRMNG